MKYRNEWTRFHWDNRHLMKHLSHLLTGLLASLFFSFGCHRVAAQLIGLDRADLVQCGDRAAAPTALPCNWA